MRLATKESVIDGQILNATHIANGAICYNFIKRSHIAQKAKSHKSAVYRHIIQDDATLKLLAIGPRQEQQRQNGKQKTTSFCDTSDFDPKKFGVRSFLNERFR